MDINYFAAIEAILFACGEPVEIERLAEGLSIDKAAVREQLNAYGASLEAGHPAPFPGGYGAAVRRRKI